MWSNISLTCVCYDDFWAFMWEENGHIINPYTLYLHSNWVFGVLEKILELPTMDTNRQLLTINLFDMHDTHHDVDVVYTKSRKIGRFRRHESIYFNVKSMDEYKYNNITNLHEDKWYTPGRQFSRCHFYCLMTQMWCPDSIIVLYNQFACYRPATAQGIKCFVSGTKQCQATR